jgi:hypothetical protein
MQNVATLRRPPEPRYKGERFPVWKIERWGGGAGKNPRTVRKTPRAGPAAAVWPVTYCSGVLVTYCSGVLVTYCSGVLVTYWQSTQFSSVDPILSNVATGYATE